MPPALHFAPYREIAEEIASRLTASSSQEVIVSSYGLAANATAELLRKSESRAVSVHVSILDTFARRVVNDAGEYPRVATEAERRLAMRAALKSIDDPMAETRGIVAMMERSYRDVRDGGMTLAEFERRARAKTLRDHDRTQRIIRVWRDYEKLIAYLQAVDPANILERAGALIESGSVAVPPQIIAGFYDMTGAQLRLLHALEKSGKLSEILVPAGDDAAYAFASRFVTSIDGNLDRLKPVLDVKKPETRLAPFDNKEKELRAVCRSIRDLLDGGTRPDRIGVTTRALDPDDVRLLDRFAGELEFGISERIETSLLAHRIGRGVATILRLRDHNFPRADVIDILRDGYQPRKRVDIDRIDVATRKARVSGGRSIDIRNASNDSLIEDYRAVVEELESLTALRQIAEHFRVESELDLAVAAAIDDIAALLDRWEEKVDAETLIELMEQEKFSGQRTTDNGQPVVWAGDVMQFRGRSFDHLFVVRAQEATFPQRRVDDPLLPDSDRRALGIREIGDGRDEERLLFQLLLDGAGAVHFSFASSDTFGKILRPSRMLKGMPCGTGFSPSGRAEARPTSSNLHRQLQLVVRAGTRSLFDGYLGDDGKVIAKIRNALQALSPTQLENFGECPQKFLLKYILGVEDYDDPDRELLMPQREKGKLDHAILERFYRSVDVLSAPDLYKRIDAIVDDAFDEEETRVPAFNRVMRNIERKATKRNLRAFIADDIADLQANALRPKHFEYKFGPKYARRGPVDHPEPFVIAAHGVGIRVEGSIDRIDEGAETIRIVDYKSGKAMRHMHLADKIDRGVRLQIALYAMAVGEFFGRHNVTGAIKPLVVRGTDPEKLRFELAEAEPRLRETLDLFVASMLRGAFPAFPNDQGEGKDYNACKYCPVNHSCRTKHSEGERRVVLQEKDPRTLLQEMS